MFYSEQLQLHKHDLKETWHVMKTIISNKKLPSKQTILMYNDKKIIDPKEIAQIFNTHFINVGTVLAENIKSNINPLSYINTTMNSISTPPVY